MLNEDLALRKKAVEKRFVVLVPFGQVLRCILLRNLASDVLIFAGELLERQERSCVASTECPGARSVASILSGSGGVEHLITAVPTSMSGLGIDWFDS